MILGAEMKKYRRIFRRRGWQGRNRIVSKQKTVDRKTKCKKMQRNVKREVAKANKVYDEVYEGKKMICILHLTRQRD